MPNPIGQVTPDESRRLYKLHERRAGLRELLLCLDPKADADLIERVKADTARTDAEFAAWWEEMSAKYAWPAGTYTINFDTHLVYPAS